MLGNNIKELRLEKGLTQAQLGSKIGVSQGAIYFWEKEINEPTAGYLIALADFFEVSVDELLSYERKHNVAVDKSKESELIKTFMALPSTKQELVLSLARELAEK